MKEGEGKGLDRQEGVGHAFDLGSAESYGNNWVDNNGGAWKFGF